MATVIKRCRGEKTRGLRAIDGFREKLMIPDCEIRKCPEFEAKSKQGKCLGIIIRLKDVLLGIYEIDPYFYKHYEKKKK